MTDQRAERRRAWGESAKGWSQHADAISQVTMPVATAMVDALAPQPGQRLLELAAGTGDVGFLAAELIQPGGELITSDFAPEMLTAAQERAKALGVEGVRFRQIDAESIDLEAGSIDGILCRWGYMLMTDPEAAMRETRRVLRPGGRVVLASWASPELNPSFAILGGTLVERGLLEHQDPDEPGPFRFADPQRIEDLLGGAGFVEDVRVDPVDFEFPYPDFETWWTTSTDMSGRAREGLGKLDDAGREEVKATIRDRLAPYTTDGALRIPARTWVASATA